MDNNGLYSQFKKNWKNFLYGGFIATILNLGAYFLFMPALPDPNAPPVPYGEVETILVTKYNPETDSIKYRANFVKYVDDCEFKKLVPFSHELGEFKKLTFSDLDGRGQDESRLTGQQTMDVEVHFHGRKPEDIELRTLHNCVYEIVKGEDENGDELTEIVEKKVSKVFSKFAVTY